MTFTSVAFKSALALFVLGCASSDAGGPGTDRGAGAGGTGAGVGSSASTGSGTGGKGTSASVGTGPGSTASAAGSSSGGQTTGSGGSGHPGSAATVSSGGESDSTGSGGAGGFGGSGGATASGGSGGHASTGSGGGSDGGAGAGAYNPCPTNGAVCKILPLGDSITYGVNDEGNAGYRGPLFATIVAAGQKITFTGSLKDGPTTVSGQTFPMQNEGHSGWGISEVTQYSGGNAGIATVIPTPAFSNSSGGTPHIVLLHIGTNDQGTLSATQMTSDLQGLINKIITNAPNALVVVAQIIPLGYGTNGVIKSYNQSIPGVVQALAAAGKHIEVVDMYTGFNTSTMLGSDSTHPNSTGYQFMAAHWYSVIGSLLPK